MNESELPLFRSASGLWAIELRVPPLRGRPERVRRSLDTACEVTARSRALALLRVLAADYQGPGISGMFGRFGWILRNLTISCEETCVLFELDTKVDFVL